MILDYNAEHGAYTLRDEEIEGAPETVLPDPDAPPPPPPRDPQEVIEELLARIEKLESERPS